MAARLGKALASATGTVEQLQALMQPRDHGMHGGAADSTSRTVDVRRLLAHAAAHG